MMKRTQSIICTVTNSLNQDQRMHRICSSLEKMGYDVLLIGRTDKADLKLLDLPFGQKRINVIFQKGFLFYAEYNLKLLWFLLFQKFDIVYSVDLDSLMPGSLVKMIRNKRLVFDAHEYFTETPELTNRPFVKFVWTSLGKRLVKNADRCISVNESLCKLFESKYNNKFVSIYNSPSINETEIVGVESEKPYILYQGMLNKGRGLEALILSMEKITAVDLLMIGEGDLSIELRELASFSIAVDRIKFLGWLSPNEIQSYTNSAKLGINLLDGSSKSYQYSLANKFFDYMHADVPSINMDFPEYKKIIDEYQIGLLLKNLEPLLIANRINTLLGDEKLFEKMKSNCSLAKKEFNWEKEESKLTKIFDAL